MNTLNELINEYNNKAPIRLHVPGHKGKSSVLPDPGLDITELSFSDNLNYPNGVILNEEEHIAEVFGARFSVLSVNGASAAVMCAVMCAVKSNDTLLVFDDAHISAYYGAIHAGAKVKRAKVTDHIAGVSLNDVKEAFNQAEKNNEKIKACLIVSPTYFGCCADLKSIINFVKSKNALCICDEAHGTHFIFGDKYPQSAVSLRADYVIHSAHKTLSALTQTGILHVCADNISREEVMQNMRLLTSTSPSYLLMASVINAVNEAVKNRNVFSEIKALHTELNKTLIEENAYRLVNYEKYASRVAFDYDPFKITVYDESLSNGYFEEKYNIYPEMQNGGIVIFALGVNTSKEDFFLLKKALIETAQLNNTKQSKLPEHCFDKHFKETIDIRSAYRECFELVPLTESAGRTGADFVNAYPPGAPIIIPGQTISETVVNRLRNAGSVNVNGIKNNMIKVVKKQ